MAKSFAITTAVTTVLRATPKGHADAVFTVTNITPRPIRGLIKAKALGKTKREWLSIQGKVEHDFAVGATKQFTIRVDVPVRPTTGTPARPTTVKYPFRLDVSTLNPDEDFTEGPTVTVELPSAGTRKKKLTP